MISSDRQKSINKLLDFRPQIISEYQKNKLKDVWFAWDSDWDHGAEWVISPVYIDATQYSIWPLTCSNVFKAFPLREIERIGFSRLQPQQELAPHKHENEGHRILHMAIDIPEGDVGIETSSGEHYWNLSGDWVLFDDNKTHSAWNRTDADRVILYIDLIGE